MPTSISLDAEGCKTPFSFLDIPAEVRVMVYHSLFRGFVITYKDSPQPKMTRSTDLRCQTRSTFQPGNGRIKHRAAMIKTCHAIFKEAVPILGKHNTLNIPGTRILSSSLEHFCSFTLLPFIEDVNINKRHLQNLHINLLPVLNVLRVHRVEIYRFEFLQEEEDLWKELSDAQLIEWFKEEIELGSHSWRRPW